MTGDVTSELAAFRLVRAPRAAVFVPLLDGVPWQTLMIGALREQCLTWGGASNIPVAWDPNVGLEPLHWDLLEAIDPDMIVEYSPTPLDLKEVNPEWYSRWEADHQALHAGRPANLAAQVLSSESETRLRPSALVDLAAVIGERRPLFGGSRRAGIALSDAEGLGYPFTRVARIRGNNEPVMVRRHFGDPDIQLMLAAACGDISSRSLASLRASGYDLGETTLSRDDAISYALGPRDPGVADAWDPSRIALNWVVPAERWGATPTVVVGDSAEDFCLAYALHRLYGFGYWIPSTLARDEYFLGLIDHLGQRASDSSDDECRLVTSISDPDLAVQTADRLSTRRGTRWTAAASSDGLKLRPNRLFGTVPSIESLTLVDRRTGHLGARWPDFKPSGLEHVYWITEVQADRWRPLADGRLSSAIIEAPGYTDFAPTRVTGEGGVAYLCPHFMRMGPQDFAAETVRPRLRVMSLREQVSFILEEHGWRAQPSDKGIYAAASVALFGGEQKLSEALESPSWWQTVQALTARTDAVGEIKFFDLKHDKRRYVTAAGFNELRELAGLEATLPELVASGVLQRGLIHKCAVCRWTGWFEAAELGTHLRCARCRAPFDLRSNGWIPDLEPRWYYRIAEVLWQFLEHDGDVPVHAVNRFIGMPGSVETMNEIEVVAPDGSQCELDICASIRGALWIGEAKRSSKLGNPQASTKTLNSLSRVAQVLRPKGIIFATAAEGWTEATANQIRSHFYNVPYEVRIESCPPPTASDDGDGGLLRVTT